MRAIRFCIACAAILATNMGILGQGHAPAEPALRDEAVVSTEALGGVGRRPFPPWWNGAVGMMDAPEVYVHRVAAPIEAKPNLRICFWRYPVAGQYPRRMAIYVSKTLGGFMNGEYRQWLIRVDRDFEVVYVGTRRHRYSQAVAVERGLDGVVEYCEGDADGFVFVATQMEPPWEFRPLFWNSEVAPTWYTYRMVIPEFGGVPDTHPEPKEWPPKLVMFTGGGHMP